MLLSEDMILFQRKTHLFFFVTFSSFTMTDASLLLISKEEMEVKRVEKRNGWKM
jgi:hypothetical protein